jgi:hypothetical protein
MPWIGPVVGAGIGAAGSLLGGSMSSSGASAANAANNRQRIQQMMFQYNMASHAHRIEVKDLRKAGLNPILSGTGGQGASTPSGASANMENVKGAGVSSALDALTTLTQAFKTARETEKVKADTENTIAQTNSQREQPGLIRAQAGLTSQQTNSARATEANIKADTRLKEIGSQVSVSELNKNNAFTSLLTKQGVTQDIQSKLLGVNVAQASEVLKGLKLDGEINASDYGEILRYIDRGLETLNKLPFLGRFAPESRRRTDVYHHDR